VSSAAGSKAKKMGEPKPYPLEGIDWSSCDESEREAAEDLMVPATMGFGDGARREM
jgi:hypothetical protein